MKHSLASSAGPVAALFDLLAAGLLPVSVAKPTGPAGTPRAGLLDRLETAHWRWRQRQVERYLAASIDVADGERRLRHLERRAFFA